MRPRKLSGPVCKHPAFFVYPFQAILGNFRQFSGNCLGPFQVISGNFQATLAISGNLGNFGGRKPKIKTSFN